LLLVHDLTNKNSFNNLKRWISEYLFRLGGTESLRWKGDDEETTETDFLELQIPHSSTTLPVLIIGNKEDLLPNDPKRSVGNFAEENGSANIEVVN
jgi:GTPase SAR1 family protein